MEKYINKSSDSDQGGLVIPESNIVKNEQHADTFLKLSKILSDKNYYHQVYTEDVSNFVPRDVSNYPNLINDHEIVACSNENKENSSEKISSITTRLFGESEKVKSLYHELSKKLDVQPITRFFLMGMNSEGKDMATICLKIDNKD